MIAGGYATFLGLLLLTVLVGAGVLALVVGARWLWLWRRFW